jgi:hypothetical protein
MMRLIALMVLLIAPSLTFAQEERIPVYVSHVGKDPVGVAFENSVRRELKRSPRYVLKESEEHQDGLRFYMELESVDTAGTKADFGKRSFVSIVIQQFGLPNSYPVAEMWYNKIIVVGRYKVDGLAKTLLDDFNARWCNHIKNSVGTCPKEVFFPAN